MESKKSKLKLKDDTYFLQTENGVYLKNNHGAFELKGNNIYKLLEKIAPLLDGNMTLDKLIAILPSHIKSVAEKLINTLYQNGFIKDTCLDKPHTLAESMKQQYAQYIHFLDSMVDSADYRFEQFQQKKVLLVSDQLFLEPLLLSVLEYGLHEINIFSLTKSEISIESILELNSNTHEQSVNYLGASTNLTYSELLKLIEPYEVVVYASKYCSLENSADINQICHLTKTVFIPITLQNGNGIVGPLTHNNSASCMHCVKHWLGKSDAKFTENLSSNFYYTLCHLTFFNVFKYLTEVPIIDLKDKVYFVDSETLEIKLHPVQAHIKCNNCINHIEYQEVHEVSEQALLSKLSIDTTKLFHPIIEFSPVHLSQVPLSQYLIKIRAGDTVREINGYGTTHHKAKMDTLIKAVETFISCTLEDNAVQIGCGLSSEQAMMNAILKAFERDIIKRFMQHEKLEFGQFNIQSLGARVSNLLILLSKYHYDYELLHFMPYEKIHCILLRIPQKEVAYLVCDKDLGLAVEKALLQFIHQNQNNQFDKQSIEMFAISPQASSHMPENILYQNDLSDNLQQQTWSDLYSKVIDLVDIKPNPLSGGLGLYAKAATMRG